MFVSGQVLVDPAHNGGVGVAHEFRHRDGVEPGLEGLGAKAVADGNMPPSVLLDYLEDRKG